MSADIPVRDRPAPPPCPTCGSDDVAPIVYGFPGEEMWEASRAGRIKLGGCVIDGRDDWGSRWHCRACAED